MTNDCPESFICSETWTQPHSHDTADLYAFILGSGVSFQKSLLIKHSASQPASINHLCDTAKPSRSRWVSEGERHLSQLLTHTPTHTHMQSAAVASTGFVWYLSVHITEMMLMLTDRLWFLKYAVIVTHSVGGLRSSNLVSKNLRTSSLWEMWEGSFIRACGGEGREKATGCNTYTYLKGCMRWKRKRKSPVVWFEWQ